MKLQMPLLLALATSLSAVPSDINYQGRLTDANGDAVTGPAIIKIGFEYPINNYDNNYSGHFGNTPYTWYRGTHFYGSISYRLIHGIE